MKNLIVRKKHWMKLTTNERRSKLIALEMECKDIAKTQGEVVMEPRHYHCDGVYAREITIPAGTRLVGEIHLHDQINVISKGKIKVITEEGYRIIKAPCTFISPAGTKRAGETITETVWTVFHATQTTDKDKIREEFIAPNYAKLDKQLGVTHELGSNSGGSSRCSSTN